MSKMDFQFNPGKRFRISSSEILKLPEYFYLVDDDEYFLSPDESNEILVKQKLSELLKPINGVIDGDKVKNLIFPTDGKDFPSFDVFISHSHNDTDKAERLAEYLREECGREPFLDNYVWSSADKLLHKIDLDWCITKDRKHFDYQKRNFSSSHVHTMLSMAIFEMIARCESFIFIESNDSIDYQALKKNNTRTQSPWIYQELQYAEMLSTAIKFSNLIAEQRHFSDLNISYQIDLEDFAVLTADSIEDAFRRNKSNV